MLIKKVYAGIFVVAVEKCTRRTFFYFLRKITQKQNLKTALASTIGTLENIFMIDRAS